MKKNIIYSSSFFLVAGLSIIFAAKLPAQEGDFSDLTSTFILLVLAGIIINILWHKETRILAKEKIKANINSDDNPVNLLQSIYEQIHKLSADFDKMSNQEVCMTIDSIFNKYINNFVERRKIVIEVFGINRGTEIILTAAMGERVLNRVWSACSDEHRPEAKKSIQSSCDHFLKSIQLTEY